MRVFVTGATGFIGSAVVDELISAGHQVVGLARSDAGAAQLTARGASVQRGSLEDLDSLTRGAAASEGVIHLAFVHDFENFAASCAKDQTAIEALGSALAGSNRPLVVSTGVLGLAQGRPGTEEDEPSHAFPRKSEETGLGFASKGVRASVVRLSPSVHGDGDHGFVPQLIDGARAQGFASYIGDGKNRWPAVHRLDAARLYRLVLEQGTAGGRYHGVAEEGVPIRDIAEVIGKRLNIPAVSRSAEEVVGALGFIGHVLAMDATGSNKLTVERLGWSPTQPGLIADLERGTYFDTK
jgi:nucleoside-diphosphate-sugar epimerase